MQVDPIHRCARAVPSGQRPWRSGGVCFALLPLAFGLLSAGLQSACTLGAPTAIALTQPLREAAPSRMGGAPAKLMAPAPAPGAARPVTATLTQAEQGDVDAMYRLALMHETGRAEVAQDPAEMLRWLALASTLGSGPASYKLYRHYDERAGGSAKALRFRELAQRQGYYGPVSTGSSR